MNSYSTIVRTPALYSGAPGFTQMYVCFFLYTIKLCCTVALNEGQPTYTHALSLDFPTFPFPHVPYLVVLVMPYKHYFVCKT